MPDSDFFKRGAGGDIAFLAKKEFDGKLRENESSKTTTGDLATLTASAGKDMYLAKAKVSVENDSDSASAAFKVTIQLKVNGVIHEQVVLSANRTTSASQAGPTSYEFAVSGVKVAATQIIKLEITAIDSVEAVTKGVITCFEEDTGVSPLT